MTGVSFEEAWAEAQNVHPDTLRLGSTFASYIPKPSQAYGLWEAALFWARVGKVIPLGRGADPYWAKKANAALLGSGWTVEEMASADPDKINEWWGTDRYANVGFPTKVNRVLIIDVDPRHGGDRTWERLCAEHNYPWDRVPRSESPALEGGTHLWFRTDTDYPHSPLARGVDRPWQVPVPPSGRPVVVDPEAKGDAARATRVLPYVWVAGDPRRLPPAPAWVTGERLDAPPTGGGGGGAQEGVDLPTTDTGAIDIDAVERVEDGSQSYVFKRVMCSMIRQKCSDEQILAKAEEMRAASPEDDQRPWTYRDFEYMLRKSHEFLKRQEAAEKERTARYSAQFPRRWRS